MSKVNLSTIRAFVAAIVSQLRWTFTPETLESLSGGEPAPQPQATNFVPWLLKGESLSHDTPTEEATTVSALAWLFSSEELEQEEPPEAPAEQRFLEMLLGREELGHDVEEAAPSGRSLFLNWLCASEKLGDGSDSDSEPESETSGEN